MARIIRALKGESGQIGSGGVAAATIPTAVLGLSVAQPSVLPATGIAVGMYVLVALACITAGLLMRWQGSRLARAKGGE